MNPLEFLTVIQNECGKLLSIIFHLEYFCLSNHYLSLSLPTPSKLAVILSSSYRRGDSVEF